MSLALFIFTNKIYLGRVLNRKNINLLSLAFKLGRFCQLVTYIVVVALLAVLILYFIFFISFFPIFDGIDGVDGIFYLNISFIYSKFYSTRVRARKGLYSSRIIRQNRVNDAHGEEREGSHKYQKELWILVRVTIIRSV